MKQKLIAVIISFFGCMHCPAKADASSNTDRSLRSRPASATGRELNYRYGLTDLDGNEIVPCKYTRILYCGNGIFQMTGEDNCDMHFFNRDGAELKFKRPVKGCIDNLESLGIIADSNKELELKRFPKETLFRFFYYGYGLCDKRGKIVDRFDHSYLLSSSTLRLEHRSLPNFRSTRLLYAPEAHSEALLKSISPTRGYSSHAYCPEVKLKHSKTNEVFQLIARERLRKMINVDTGRFDSISWKRTHSKEMFDRFLKEYKLIGMPEDKLFRLLGEGMLREPIGYTGDLESVRYAITTIAGSQYLKLSFANGKVKDWKIGGYND